ncbi:hypothetical protein [Cupriavidus sp. AU9028]|uniref:hypothetical protein n=1 Tax=Cupriavidus sp. AU9028 TaxID=2871157 RepID=UPI001C964AA3|nr:hypothetical protein [Cupriavidus sp. AU9028]MBY4896064.1 hypothetical protein [Cupriavidus sp. AU9028]
MRTQSSGTTGQCPGDLTRSQWLAELRATGTASADGLRDANPWRIACERQANSIAIPAAAAYYAALWPKIRFLADSTRCHRGDPAEGAARQVAELSQTVLGLHAKMVEAEAEGRAGEPEPAQRLLLACQQLDNALDTLHEHLEGHLKGHAWQPRMNGKAISRAVGKLLVGLVLMPGAILVTVLIAGQSLALVLSAVGLIADAAVSLVAEGLRCRRATRLPAALHLYPSHRDALRRFAHDTREDGSTVLKRVSAPDLAPAGSRAG